MVEIERRHRLGHLQVRLVEAGDGPDVAPVARMQKAEDPPLTQGIRNHLLAEVDLLIALEELPQDRELEDIDAHAGEQLSGTGVELAAGDGRLVERQLGDQRLVLGLLLEADHPSRLVHPQHTQPLGLSPRHRFDGNGQIRFGLPVALDEGGEVHQVELVSRQDDHLRGATGLEPPQILTHGVGRPLVPVPVLDTLRRRQQIDEPRAEDVEAIGLSDVTVQAGRVELGQHEDLVDPGVQAVADRNVDEPELAGHRYRRLGAILRQRPESAALTTTQNRCDHSLHRAAAGSHCDSRLYSTATGSLACSPTPISGA